MNMQFEAGSWVPVPAGTVAVVRYDPSRKEQYFLLERALAVSIRGTGEYRCQGGYDMRTTPPGEVLVFSSRGKNMMLHVYRNYEGMLEPKVPSRVGRVEFFLQEGDLSAMTLEQWQEVLDPDLRRGGEVRLLDGTYMRWDAEKRSRKKRESSDAGERREVSSP